MKCLVLLALVALCYSTTPSAFPDTKFGGNINFWKYLGNKGYGFDIQKNFGYPSQYEQYPYYQQGYSYPYSQDYYSHGQDYSQEYYPYSHDYYYQKYGQNYPQTQDYFSQKYGQGYPQTQDYFYQKYGKTYPTIQDYSKYGQYYPGFYSKYFQGQQQTTEDVPVDTKQEVVTPVQQEVVPQVNTYSQKYDTPVFDKYFHFQGQFPYGYKGFTGFTGQYFGQYPAFYKHKYFGSNFLYPGQQEQYAY